MAHSHVGKHVENRTQVILINTILYLASCLPWFPLHSIYSKEWHPVLLILVANTMSTLVIFCGSFYLNNSSMFDLFWSVGPFFTSCYCLYLSSLDNNSNLRTLLVFATVFVWSWRLSINCLQRWTSLAEEDWRYNNFRKYGSVAYWCMSLSSFHLMPNLVVTMCSLPFYYSMTLCNDTPINYIDWIALSIAVTAITLELVADYQMNQFLSKKEDKKEHSKVMDKGLWSISRHPNYLGEILFWYGQFIFYWSCRENVKVVGDEWLPFLYAGPISVTLLFSFASIPLMEARSLARRPAYKDYQKRTKMIIPYIF